jgi:hypothetical protein
LFSSNDGDVAMTDDSVSIMIPFSVFVCLSFDCAVRECLTTKMTNSLSAFFYAWVPDETVESYRGQYHLFFSLETRRLQEPVAHFEHSPISPLFFHSRLDDFKSPSHTLNTALVAPSEGVVSMVAAPIKNPGQYVVLASTRVNIHLVPSV